MTCRARDLRVGGGGGPGIEIADYLAINLVVFDVGERPGLSLPRGRLV